MKRVLSFGLLAAALVAAAPPLHAGQKVPVAVTILAKYHQFYGAVSTARNSTDQNQRLSCEIYGYANGTTVGCTATDAQRNFAYCFSDNANVVRAARAIQGDSQIYVWYDDTGTCTAIGTYVDSAVEPKEP